MKRFFSALLLAGLVLSCNQGTKENPYSSLLAQPPYKVYTDSLHDFPKNAGLYASRGGLLLKNGQTDAALYDLKKAYDLERNDVNAWYYGAALINLQRYDSAIHHLKKSSIDFPQNLSIRERLAYALNQKRKYTDAIAVYDEILALDSTDFRSWAAKAYIYQSLEKEKEAQLSFERSYALFPTQAVGEEIAFVYAEKKDPRCLSFCDLLIRRDSFKTSVQPYYCKGLYYKNTGNTAEALKLFDYCMKADYNFPDAFMEKGQILFSNKQYEEARRIFQLVKSNNNSYADAFYWLGRCFEAEGKKPEAALEYERALALDKEFTEAKEGLERTK